MSHATITLLFLLFAIIMFMWEKIPLGLTSMIVCVGLVVTGVLDWKTAFMGFIDSNVILFVAMFIVGGALFETGMANKIGGIVTHFAKSEKQLIIAIMVIVGLMSGVLSNTGTAAVLIPVVIGIAAKSGYSRSRLLMPLVFAAAMGGNLSLIGAPGNLIAQSAMQEIGKSFGFFDYAKVGFPILIVGVIFFALIGNKLLPNNKLSDDDSAYSSKDDFSDVPKWKQWLSLIILILTLLGMIFEDNKIDRENTDLYLLDVYLPDGDGFSVCEKLRSEGCVTPVIFLTSCDDEDSITKGLDIGGDDYITKPFRVSELLSRISANLRRQAMLDKSISNMDKSNSNIYTLGSLVINFDNLTIKKAAKDIQLSPTEFALLEILVCNRGLIVRREVFFQKLWDRMGTFVEDNTLTVTVSRLKTKLGKMDNSDKNYIDTIRGVGYRWRER